MLKNILIAIGISVGVILIPIVLILLMSVIAIAWPLMIGLLILITPGIIVGVLVGTKKKESKGSE